ncbi:hypothetical protein SISNIDRAFT_475202 [Sistotremastrum niveocremeum HHB9708]|uniref:7alpha-cephem-methoxylase P8 chain related protein n=1 Tax=Sistotremastrum niveocremeum HHB9708 TaxID=1314777 RepID=A0A164RTR3_9AGAM|nr:hypothetical protein SISNIDRAFT_475202 [Sistotremastrum niveocremeum HHB9708]
MSVGTVSATLNYFVPPLDGSKPLVNINPDPRRGIPATNFGTEEKVIEITDLRGQEHTTNIDVHGFQYFKVPTKEKAFNNDQTIKSQYYTEQANLIKKLTRASRVVMFDHTIRHNKPGDEEDTPENRHPVPRVHVDQTAESARARVIRHLPPSDTPRLLAGRYQIINLWRPIHNPAYDFPLALCDYRTMNPSTDLVPTTLKYPDRDGETFSVKFSPRHKWNYVRGMGVDEGVLIKCFDSVDDGSVAVLTPHTAFIDPTTPKDAPLRSSIELRALVFYD